MNEIGRLKEIVKEKSKNILTDSKAKEVLDTIKRKIPSGSLEDKLKIVSKYSELPGWLNDALTINETFFFRHPEQFNFLGDYIDEKMQGKRPLKVLCGGVSTGEEAYSLAFLLEKHVGMNFDITAVDISNEAIEKAKNGIYHQSLIARAPKEFEEVLKKNLQSLSVKEKEKFKVKDAIRNKIRFKASNIFNLPLDNYDIIFFRNILIYFEQEDKEQIYDKLSSHLNLEGVMMIGAGELFPKKDDRTAQAFKTSAIKRVA